MRSLQGICHRYKINKKQQNRNGKRKKRKANQNMRAQNSKAAQGGNKKCRWKKNEQKKKENNLINCKKGMIMAKRVWAPETATCGATETARERGRYGDRGSIGCTSQLNIVQCAWPALCKRAEVKSIKAPNGCYYIISCRTNSSQRALKHIKWK